MSDFFKSVYMLIKYQFFFKHKYFLGQMVEYKGRKWTIEQHSRTWVVLYDRIKDSYCCANAWDITLLNGPRIYTKG